MTTRVEVLELRERIEARSAVVAVMGLGYVGLPLIQVYLAAGLRCIGYDVDQSKVDSLLAGQSYIKHIDSAWLGSAIANGSFEPTTDPARLAVADCILVCVPTPLTESRDPDLRYVEQTAETIAKVLRPGQLISLESTTYPGTTRDVMLPILEQSGLKAGADFLLAYSPEREDPGNPDFGTGTIPKVVGGFDTNSLDAAVSLYGAAVQKIVPVSSLEVAEACKILENTYRAVNIALVNELKMLLDRMDIDVWEVIDAASTKPFGFQRFTPGPGLGGHCIPIDPFYLSWLARKHGLNTRFVELAGEINHAMPQYVVDKVGWALNEHGKPVKGSKIGIIGVAYKPNVDDQRESPAFAVMELLGSRGAVLSFHDPHIAETRPMRSFDVPALQSEELTADYLQGLDAVVVITDHSLVDWDLIAKHAPLVIDTRNVVPDNRGTHLVRA
jgi:UDP-N-acetyl-D-glucosamine dehydrogenase